jgi:intracellular septation protein
MSPRKNAVRLFLLGGALPIVVFAVVEQIYGTLGGVIAGLVFGGGEIAWELLKSKRVQGITLLSNFLVLVLGLLSLWENDGIFFKMQPAIFMLVFAGVFLVSSMLGRPFLLEMTRQQNSCCGDRTFKRNERAYRLPLHRSCGVVCL